METILITITLSLIGVSNVLLIAVLGFIAFKYISSSEQLKEKSDKNRTTKDPVPSDIDKEAEAKREKEYMEQLAAINDLMNYNADVAYGIKPKED